MGSATPEEEIAAETWFSVREHDIFPRIFEFLSFQSQPCRHFFNIHSEIFRAISGASFSAKSEKADIPEVFLESGSAVDE